MNHIEEEISKQHDQFFTDFDLFSQEVWSLIKAYNLTNKEFDFACYMDHVFYYKHAIENGTIFHFEFYDRYGSCLPIEKPKYFLTNANADYIVFRMSTLDFHEGIFEDSYSVCFHRFSDELTIIPKVIYSEDLQDGDIFYYVPDIENIKKEDYEEIELIGLLSSGFDDIYIRDDIYDTDKSHITHACNNNRFLKTKYKEKVVRLFHYGELLNLLRENL